MIFRHSAPGRDYGRNAEQPALHYYDRKTLILGKVNDAFRTPDDVLFRRFRDETKVNESIARRNERLVSSANEDQFCTWAKLFGVVCEPLAKKGNVLADFLTTGVDKITIR